MADPANPDLASAWGALAGTPVPDQSQDTSFATPVQNSTTPAKAPTRNNPGNLRPLPTGSWNGQTGVDGGFAVFNSPEAGQAAAEQNLIAKQSKHGLKSLNDIIGDPTYGWAPASDHNDPAAYARTVARTVGVDPSAPIDLVNNADLRQKVLAAMYGVEQGAPQPASSGDATGALKDAWDVIAGNVHQGPASYSFPAGTRSITPSGDTFKGPNGETYKRDAEDPNIFTDAGGARYHIVDPNGPKPRADKYLPGDQQGPELTDAQLKAQYGQPASLEKPLVDTGALGAADALVRKGANALTGGYADKLAAAIAALPQSDDGTNPSGQGFESAYSSALDRQRATDSQAGVFHPASSIVGTTAGALGQGLILPEVKAASLGGRIVQGFGQGAALGAVNASGQARGGFGDVVSQSVVPTILGGVTGGALNAALGPVRPSNDALGAYARVPVDPTLAVNGGRTAQQFSQMLKGLPIVGIPLSQAAARTSSQLDEGVLAAAQRYGQSTNAAQAGGALQEGAATARDALKAGVDQAYEPLNPLEASPNLVPASNTAQAIADLKSRYPNTPEWFRSNAPVISRLDDTLTNNNDHLTYGEMKNIRSDVGSLASGSINNDVNTMDQAALQRVYGAMSKDMENGVYNTAYQQSWKATRNADVARQAGLDAQTQLVAANAANQQMRDTVTNTLLPVMNAKSPEAAFEKVLGAASSGSSRADITALTQAKATLSPEAWNEVAAGTIARMGREGNDASGAFSPAKFATALGKLSPEGRAAIFGTGDSAKDIAAFEQIAKDQVAASKFYNHSNSGNVLATLGGLGGTGTAGYQAAHGNFAPAVMAGIAGIGGILAAKLLASPGAARFLLDVTRAKPSMIDNMFARYASAHPDIAPQLTAIRNRLPGVATAAQESGSQPTPSPSTRGAALPLPVQ